MFAIKKDVTDTNRTNSCHRYYVQPSLFVNFKKLQHSLSQSRSDSLVFWKSALSNPTKEKLIHMEFVMQAFQNCGLLLRQLFRK
jgi:hypothetical protein